MNTVVINNTRFKDYRKFDSTTQYSVDKAFAYFAENELGFGSKVTNFTETSITVENQFMGCHDIIVFESDKETIQKFLQFTTFVLANTAMVHGYLIEAVDVAKMVAERCHDYDAGKAFSKTFLEVTCGENAVYRACAKWLGIEKLNNKYKLSDFCTAVGWNLFEDLSVEEARGLFQ